MKTCGKCNQSKELSEFSWRNKAKGSLSIWCRPCFKTYSAKRHQKINVKRLAQGKAWRAVNHAKNHKHMLRYLAKHPCLMCGERHPAVLEFDHLRDKKMNVSEMMVTRAWPTILLEIDKCQVLCSNCHRRKTAKDRGFYTVTHPLVEELFPGL